MYNFMPTYLFVGFSLVFHSKDQRIDEIPSSESNKDKLLIEFLLLIYPSVYYQSAPE